MICASQSKKKLCPDVFKKFLWIQKSVLSLPRRFGIMNNKKTLYANEVFLRVTGCL